MHPEKTAPPQQPERSEDGVDLTLIRWMLSMSPAQRLEAFQQFVDAVLRVRAGNPQV